MEGNADIYDEQEYQLDEIRRRKNKMLALLLLLLLLLLLGFAALAYLFLRAPGGPSARGNIDPLFSIYGLDRPLYAGSDSKGNLYVSDTGNGRLMVFDSQGDFVKRIGRNTREMKMYAPYGSYIDEKAKRVYVTDYRYRRVHVYSLDGKILFRFPTENQKRFGSHGFSPFGIAEYKGRLFVTSNNGIYIFNKKGKILDRWVKQGQDVDEYLYPDAITIDPDTGNVYVADTLNKRVKALDSKGNVRWILGVPDSNGKVKSFLSLPRGVVWDKSRGFLFITDTFRNRLIVLTADGKLVSIVGARGVQDGQFNFPEGLAVRPDHTLVIADRENNRVQVVNITRFPKPRPADVKKYNSSFIKVEN